MSTLLSTPIKEIRWSGPLIRQLRGKRTLVEVGRLVGVPKNTVWRWEKRRASPDAANAHRLSALAQRESFLANWRLAGSGYLLGDLEEGRQQIRDLFRKSV